MLTTERAPPGSPISERTAGYRRAIFSDSSLMTIGIPYEPR